MSLPIHSASHTWAPVTLPYYREDFIKKHSVPRVEEIRSAEDVLSQRNTERVVALSLGVVVRHGLASNEREGQNLLFLESQRPELPIPRLLAMFREGEELFIVMERIHGQRLDTLWPCLSASEKDSVIASLKNTLKHIRSLKGQFFGSVDRGSLPHHLFYTTEHDPARSGPFDSEQELNRGLLQQYQYVQALNGYQDYKSQFYENAFARVLQGHAPVFSHTDIQRKNIIVKGLDRSGHSSSDMTAYLVDWEDAGWYPEYWEYFSMFTTFSWVDDWCERAAELVDVWPAETAVMKLMHTDLFM